MSFLETIPDFDQSISFTERLRNTLSASPSIKNIVVCGFIAQTIFMKIAKIPIPQYNKIVNRRTKSGKYLNILFVNHPSSLNDKWDFRPSSL